MSSKAAAGFPNLAKEIRLPGSPGSSESPKEVGPKEEYTKALHNHPKLRIRRES